MVDGEENKSTAVSSKQLSFIWFALIPVEVSIKRKRCRECPSFGARKYGIFYSVLHLVMLYGRSFVLGQDDQVQRGEKDFFPASIIDGMEYRTSGTFTCFYSWFLKPVKYCVLCTLRDSPTGRLNENTGELPVLWGKVLLHLFSASL